MPIPSQEMSPAELMEHIQELQEVMLSCNSDSANPEYQKAKEELRATGKLLAKWATELAS